MSGRDISRWADRAMVSAEEIEGRGPRVFLVSATPDPLGSIASTCAMYEGKVIRSKHMVTDEMRKYYWEQDKKTHLKAPLEYVDFHFLIEGVTRSVTHQIVRQRTAVYAQESMRFAVKENLANEVDLPVTIKKGSDEEAVWNSAIEHIDRAYNILVNSGVPAEDARGLLPHSTKTRMHYKTNLRNLIDTMQVRLCTQAQFEWREVVAGIVRAIGGYESPRDDYESGDNWQFDLIAKDDVFKPVCFSLGHCPFTSDMDRPCSIRDQVEEGKFSEIRDEQWLLDPNAAR